MRLVLVLLIGLACVSGARADAKDPSPPAPRYGVAPDLQTYPQKTPRDTLASVVKALADKRVDYLLAHLADPEWVDKRVKDYGGNFQEVLREATTKLLDDPGAARKLQKLLAEGEWKIDKDQAFVKPAEGERWAHLRQTNGRWVMENRYRPEEDAKDVVEEPKSVKER
jgi:hypothetical protein